VVKRPQKGIINLIVVDAEEMAQMNKQFRGKEGPTDILTFSYLEKSNIENRILKIEVVGEIYLCLEKIKLYAKESGKTYREQLEYIVIH
jgi:probable rRNA maturation factor